MPRAIAINVGANTSLPGFRGPIYPDGRFVYVPIPERKPTRDDASVPRYRDLELPIDLPHDVLNRRVHFDPEFPEYPVGYRYTYGDEHGVKSGPLSALEKGDIVFFYSTLSTAGGNDDGSWIAPEWGAYLIGKFTLATDPVIAERIGSLPDRLQTAFRNNAHVKRERFDARVLLIGDDSESGLFDRAVPLSDPDAGAEPNDIVTALSLDSGRGPWWRRPLRFDAEATQIVLDRIRRRWPPE